MTAQELLEWAIKNIHTTNWRYMLIMKVNEDKIKALTAEQVKGIELFVDLMKQNKHYNGFGGVIDEKYLDEILVVIKSTKHE